MAEPKKEPKRKKDDKTGKEILVYDSGLVKDADTGQIIKPPPKHAGQITTSEQGHAMITARHENIRAKTRKEMLRLTKEAYPDADIKTEDDAYAFGVAATWGKTVLNEKAYPRDKLDAVEKIGRIADFIPRPSSQPEPPGEGVQLFANLGPEAILDLAEIFEKAAEEKHNANKV